MLNYSTKKGLDAILAPLPWSSFGKKLTEKILNPRNTGVFTQEDADARAVRFVTGKSGELETGNYLKLYWLVDKEDGTILDAKFQVFGQSALIGAAEIACELIVGKNYDQAGRLSFDLIDKQARDKGEKSAFPDHAAEHLNLTLDAIEEAASSCTDIPLSVSYQAPPAPTTSMEPLEGGYPGWDTLNKKAKLALIEEVLDQEVRPYIALDGGGIEVLDLANDWEVLIAYKGNCTSCFSSVGATLSFIQQMVRAKVHANLSVVPDLENTKFN